MAGLKHNRLRHCLRNLLLVAVGAVWLAGCGARHYEPRLELVRGTLQSQEGEFPITAVRYSSYPESDNWNLSMAAETGSLRVGVGPFGPFNPRGRLTVSPQNPDARVEFLGNNAFYEMNFTAQQRLVTDRNDEFLTSNDPTHMLLYTLPESLNGLFPNQTTAITEDDVERIDAMADDVHRLYFEFSVDGNPYVVDVAFRLKSVRVRTSAAQVEN